MSGITWTFESLDQMGAYFERKAQEIRVRIPAASSQSKNVMRAEAHAYEQAASLVRSSVIKAAEGRS